MSTARNSTKAAPTGQLRLLRRKPPQVVHYLRAVEPEVESAARQAVTDARDRLSTATMRIDDAAVEAIEAAQATLDQAQAALAACYEPIVIQALPPDEFEALVAEHPKREDKDESFNADTLLPVLFLRCVQGDLTAEQWTKEVIPQLSNGERRALESRSLDVNGRFSDGLIPKG
jgi:chemotaxis regulatin CheY-phosphate phosphatase CheZ